MMKNTLIKIVAFVGAITMLTNNNLYAEQYHFGAVSNIDNGTLGTYAQWNEEYAVTAYHVPPPVGEEYFGMKCLDIRFFKNRGVSQKWDFPSFDEEVIAAGYTVFEENGRKFIGNSFVEGIVKEDTILLYGKYQAFLHTGEIKPGMSGGPVYRKRDGSIVGVSKGFIDEKETGSVGGSIFIPTNMIQGAWDYVMKNNINKLNLENKIICNKNSA